MSTTDTFCKLELLRQQLAQVAKDLPDTTAKQYLLDDIYNLRGRLIQIDNQLGIHGPTSAQWQNVENGTTRIEAWVDAIE